MPPLYGNGEWWRSIPRAEIGPIQSHAFGTMELNTPTRFQPGTRAILRDQTPLGSIYRGLTPVRSVASIEAANNAGIDPAAATKATTDPTLGGTRNLSGMLTPEGLAAVRAGISIAGKLTGPVGGLIAGVLNLGIGLFGSNLQPASPAQVAPDVPIGLDVPAGLAFTDPAYGVASLTPDPTQDIQAPSQTGDPLSAAPDPAPDPENIAGPMDFNTGAQETATTGGAADASTAAASGDTSQGTDQSGGSGRDSGADQSGGGGGADSSSSAGDRSGDFGGERGQTGGF